MSKEKTHKIKLSYYFASLITATIVVTSILFAIYLSLTVNDSLKNYQSNIAKVTGSLIEVMLQSLSSDIKKMNFTSSEKTVRILKENYLISYVYVSFNNGKSEKIVFPLECKGKRAENCNTFKSDTEADSLSVKQFVLPLSGDEQAEDSSIKESEKKYKIYFGVPVEKMKSGIYGNFSMMIFHFLAIFAIFAAVVSYFMADSIAEPLGRLSKAAKQIMEGNFNIKIEPSKFDEINTLVFSYNEMTTQLNELYSSLESKVQERTLELEEANYKLKETQAMMVHSEKMRSLGELVAGIAHEINNPVNFIHGNIMILQNYADDLIGLIDLYSEFDCNLPDDFKQRVIKLKKDIDIDFLRSDIKDLIRSCIEGTQRTKNIVLDLKNFSRMEEMVLTQFDIPKEIDTTLNILNNKYKNRITVVKNYSSDVPKIEAYGGQLNQVFMNILDNAQDAMAETGTLTINVDKIEDNKVKIEFIDTGSGISPENIKKVFDPFFTTKAVGKGTGLGMSISYRVIHDHNGTIDVDSEVGKGTKFTIILPINHENKNTDSDKSGVQA